MDEDDFAPRKKAVHEVGGDLSSLSLEDLSCLIEDLKSEILRIETEMSRKKSTKETAHSIFKS